MVIVRAARGPAIVPAQPIFSERPLKNAGRVILNPSHTLRTGSVKDLSDPVFSSDSPRWKILRYAQNDFPRGLSVVRIFFELFAPLCV